MKHNKDIKTYFVTGANGYIGRHVVRKLLDEGFQVIATDFNVEDIDSRADCIKLDIFQDSLDFLVDYKSISCIHLAWKDGFLHNSYSHIQNLSAHFEFINKVHQHGCSDFTIMGTMHEVGLWEGEITDETPCNPQSFYGIAKDSFRRTMMLFSEKNSISLKWLRAFYIYGDNTRGNSVFSKIYEAAMNGQKFFPFTDGKTKYDFLSIDDLSEQIVLSAAQQEVEGIINVCSGKPQEIGNVVEYFINNNNLDIKLKYGVFPKRPYDPDAIWGNSDKINEIIRNRKKESEKKNV